jgi:dCMP deaminase
MGRPSRDDMLMDIALAAARRSTCSRAHVGAVISREGRPLSLGYNGAPSGMPHCDHSCDCYNYYPPADERNLINSGVHEDGCKATQPCLISVHAEVNAIAFAARHGVATDQSELHMTLSPCWSCSQNIINAGIIRVVYDQPYRITDGLTLLRNAGIAVERLR